MKVIIVFFLLLLVFGSVATANADNIVSRNGNKLRLDNRDFYFAGTNFYGLFTMQPAEIDKAMAAMQADGVKVVRTWCASHDYCAFEPKKGVYDEQRFQLFDYILQSANKHNIRVLVCLENYWEAYGGIDTRLQWEGLPGGTGPNRAKFYTTLGCRVSYKNFVKHVISRTNTLTGVAYKNDPTIFAWELMNEPRCQGVGDDSTGYILRAWVDEMAGFIKSLDSKHLVGTGLEGHGTNYGFGGDDGNPFIKIQRSPYIDYCTAHVYPDEPWAGLNPEQTGQLISRYIYDAEVILNKPFFLEEFNSRKNQTEYWQAMYGAIEHDNAAGDLFWDYYLAKPYSEYEMTPDNPLLKAVFRPHALVMQNK
ncbi:MAG: cellulase family glycosylhydrolase [Bacillota bacterium]